MRELNKIEKGRERDVRKSMWEWKVTGMEVVINEWSKETRELGRAGGGGNNVRIWVIKEERSVSGSVQNGEGGGKVLYREGIQDWKRNRDQRCGNAGVDEGDSGKNDKMQT